MELYNTSVNKYGNRESCKQTANTEMASQLICQNCNNEHNLAYTDCGHCLCEDCIVTGAGDEAICPICNNNLTPFGREYHGENTCVICQDSMRGPRGFLACGHCYCYHCIARWILESQSCPICKMGTSEIIKAPPIIDKSPPGPREVTDSLPRFLSLDSGLDPGDQRGSGDFYCPCGRRWRSTNAYAGVRQGCASCRREVGPGRVTPLAEGLSAGTHRTDLCEMCQKMGRDCSSQQRFTLRDLDTFCEINSTYTN